MTHLSPEPPNRREPEVSRPLIYLAGPLFAYCQKYLQGIGKLLIGLHTDTRAAFIGSRLNPMVRVALDYIVDDEEALLRILSGNGAQVQPLEERSDERT